MPGGRFPCSSNSGIITQRYSWVGMESALALPPRKDPLHQRRVVADKDESFRRYSKSPANAGLFCGLRGGQVLAVVLGQALAGFTWTAQRTSVSNQRTSVSNWLLNRRADLDCSRAHPTANPSRSTPADQVADVESCQCSRRPPSWASLRLTAATTVVSSTCSSVCGSARALGRRVPGVCCNNSITCSALHLWSFTQETLGGGDRVDVGARAVTERCVHSRVRAHRV